MTDKVDVPLHELGARVGVSITLEPREIYHHPLVSFPCIIPFPFFALPRPGRGYEGGCPIRNFLTRRSIIVQYF